MSKIPNNLDINSTNNYPILISLGLGLLILSLSWRFFAIIVIGSGLVWTFRRYREQQKNQQDCLNDLFYKLIQENQGHITALDLAMNSQLSGKIVQEFLDERAKEFGAELEITEQGGLLYYFPTAVSLVSGQAKEELELPTEKILGYNGESVSEEIIEKVSNPWTSQQYSQVNYSLKFDPKNNHLEAANKAVSIFLTQKELASRLNVHASTISKRKTKPDFSQWSSQKDPESIPWKYLKEQGRFLPKN
ncbi:hypothetical protein ACP6PL_18545 [Dapis sp. BLCC M126]|uniref:hypothetical protein n=1 Tax=Dapis sp. BLCC M126 TaxID=3400189 RepID=UPI003CF0BAB1